MDNNQNRTSTSTQIRNMYSDGVSYMNIKFFNTNLSFSLYPFISKDQVGRSNYDMKNGIQTTVNFEGAFALADAAKGIIDGKIAEMSQPIPCLAGASIMLERKANPAGIMNTTFSITKNNVTIPFVFQTMERQVKENGQVVTKTIESGLGAFMKTIEGYLVGINADRHLDKLTDDFAKLQQGQQGSQQQQGGYNNYRNNNYRKPYNNNGGGYKKPYNGGYQNNQGGWNNNQPKQQDMSSYNIQN